MSSLSVKNVTITEVGPRDGLQSEPIFVPSGQKIALVEALISAGLKSFEITSFVSPRAVPQMADAANVIKGLRQHKDVELTTLVPNAQGAARAADVGVDAMVIFLSASESHNLKNLNCGRQSSLEGAVEIARIARANGIRLHAAISTAFGCPFEGEVPVESVRDIALTLCEHGITRFSLGDTTGMATPKLVRQRCRVLQEALPDIEIALHFHNTRGVGLVCAYVGLEEGITLFESSIGGLGGCPFVPDATGNISTEDLVYMLEESGIETGIDLGRLIEVAKIAERTVGHALPGQVMKAGPRLRRYAMADAKTATG
jgi:hydroxymethylglutaryl-CoA lyase